MSDESEMDSWVAEDTGVPEVQRVNPDRKILRLMRQVKTLTVRGKQLEDRVTALEARLPPP